MGIFPGIIINSPTKNLQKDTISGSFIEGYNMESENSILKSVQKIIDNNIPSKNIKSYDDVSIIKNHIREKKFNRILKTKTKQQKQYSIVTNGRTGQDILDEKNFILKKLGNTNNYLYQIGTYNSIKIYVNAFLRWDENFIYVIKDDFYYVDNIIKSDDIFAFDSRKKYQYDFYYQENLSIFVDKYKID